MKISYVRYPHSLIEISRGSVTVGLWFDRLYVHRWSDSSILVGLFLVHRLLPVRLMLEAW